MNIRKTAALFIALCMITASLAACGSGAGSETTSAQAAAAETTAAQTQAEETTAEETTAEETTEEEETVPKLEPDADGNVTVTDMAGREVTFPANPMVWNSSPTCDAWTCAIIPDQIVGFAAEMSEEARSYLPESVRDIPTLGGNYGQNEANSESVIAAGIDVIVNTYDLSDDEAIQTAITSADEMEERYGVPVLVLSRNIADSPENAWLIGYWFGQSERGKEVSEYMQKILDEVDATIDAVPEDEVLTYYYAEGTDGTQTEAQDSFHADVFIYCRLNAAVGDLLELTTHGGMEQVSLEQIIGWDPDIIFVWNPAAYDIIVNGDAWVDLTAVREGRVYLNPSLPLNWFDRSPNAFRILGTLYCAATCYPEYATYDLDSEVKDFFSFMYDVDLTDEQLDALYSN